MADNNGFQLGPGSEVKTPKPNFQMRTPGAQVPRVIPGNPPAFRPLGEVMPNMNKGFTMGQGADVTHAVRPVRPPLQIGYNPGPAGPPPVIPKVIADFGPKTSVPPVQPKVTGWEGTPSYSPKVSKPNMPLAPLKNVARFGAKNLGKGGIAAFITDMMFPNSANALGTHPDSGEEAGILNWKPSAQWNPNAPSALPLLITQEAARTPIPTNYPSPPATATNQQHGSGNPDILKHYGSGYMQSEGNTTVMDSNGDMMRLNKGGYQMPALSGGALSTIPSAVESPSAEGMSASESMQRFGNVHGSYATNAMAQNQPQPPSWRNIYDDVTGNRGNMALHRWDEEDKIAKSVNDRYIGALKAYDSALGPINSQITADAHRYGADQTARAHMYGADQTARAGMYGHDQQLAGHRYDADSQADWRKFSATEGRLAREDATKQANENRLAATKENANQRRDANYLTQREKIWQSMFGEDREKALGDLDAWYRGEERYQIAPARPAVNHWFSKNEPAAEAQYGYRKRSALPEIGG